MNKGRVVLVLLVLWAASVIATILWPLLFAFRGKEVVRAATQTVNAALGGLARESFSSRLGRGHDYQRIRRWVDRADSSHCDRAAKREWPLVSRIHSGEEL